MNASQQSQPDEQRLYFCFYGRRFGHPMKTQLNGGGSIFLPRLILVIVATVVLVLFPWLDPAQMQTLFQGFIQQIFQSLNLP